jgi:hypothetical protein
MGVAFPSTNLAKLPTTGLLDSLRGGGLADRLSLGITCGIAISGKRFADKDFEERLRAIVLVVASLAHSHFWDHPLLIRPRCPTASGNTVPIQHTTTILQITTIDRGMDSYHENIFSKKNPTSCLSSLPC